VDERVTAEPRVFAEGDDRRYVIAKQHSDARGFDLRCRFERRGGSLREGSPRGDRSRFKSLVWSANAATFVAAARNYRN
jgi:hypothetical protein